MVPVLPYKTILPNRRPLPHGKCSRTGEREFRQGDKLAIDVARFAPAIAVPVPSDGSHKAIERDPCVSPIPTRQIAVLSGFPVLRAAEGAGAGTRIDQELLPRARLTSLGIRRGLAIVTALLQTAGEGARRSSAG